jgi:hypothetical protein
MVKKKKKKNRTQEQETIFNFVLVLFGSVLVILGFILLFNLGGVDEAVNCKKEKGHWCYKHELEKVEDK